MNANAKTNLLVGSTAIFALVATLLAWQIHMPFPGYWQLGSFLIIAFVLDQTSLPLRVAASGSTSFVMHMAAGVLFGGFWGGIVAGVSAGTSQIVEGVAKKKVVFNVSQRMLSVVLASWVYQMCGGGTPPAYLRFGEYKVAISAVQVDLALFFLFAAVYFCVNSVAVSTAVATSSSRMFREVWSLNTRGVIGYDLSASVIAMLVAFAYASSEHVLGFGPYGLFAVIGPIVVVRHIYGLYHQLQDSGQELLQVMVKAIEARDPYTSGHSLRVSEFSRAIALELGLPTRDVELVRTAALLHDVGKIHEEFAPLLRKEARLTEEETALMQTHSTKSAELVGIISKFRGFIQDSVRHHHERWDGKGYPAGLSGKEIPLGSRIILISDTVDAMTTDRPYRKRLPLEVVIAELQKCKGTQFDPSLVDVVVNSVAVRAIIAGSTKEEGEFQPTRSRRVSWPSGSLWKGLRAEG
jgi:putative nucleotidyltransferase with HDIG domain